ncbi:aspartate/glutamate racemase family protein [Halodesulfovibrio sp.]|jgi:aspartate racemase|uniref:aspartate/glutamate racemase family protein n=1 Tax=Halodesulfovibrio sp. TaxID=1912772 RepID=UPI0025DCF143|nr:aspartate/glutamate racemase family protein [Halodesulfovibrio sp.]MCT4626608.1 aspartate/glutamate racemase family protein [Halodesulfovibrio sp.]
MKKIGLIGGMSWESTVTYYRLLNEGVRERLGGLHSCRILMESVDFSEYETLMQKDDWEGIGNKLTQTALNTEAAGADMLLIGANTMHMAADTVQSSLEIPLIHIADAIAEKAKELNVQKLGLLGTTFTMEKDFITRPLTEKYGLDVLIPDEKARTVIHDSIFNEFCYGKFISSTREKYIRIIQQLERDGAEAIILGCTEIALLVKPTDCNIPLIDTVQAHVDAALNAALGE